MQKYRVTLENSGGELDHKMVDANDDPELTQAVIDFILDIETLRDGDVIRISEQT